MPPNTKTISEVLLGYNMGNLIMNKDIPDEDRNQYGVANPFIYLFAGWRKIDENGNLINFAGCPPKNDEIYQKVYKVVGV